jgi:acyl-CoA synthetase (AMP-forming)/AMP-acid ligase II
LHSGKELDFRGLAQHLRNVLPKYAVPLFIRITEAMKLTGNMKHQKHELREEGADLDKCKGDRILWLKGNTYVDFTKKDWEEMKGGQVKL